MTINTDLIILAYGQSNERGIGPTVLPSDQDASGTIVEYHSTGSVIPGEQPMTWAAGDEAGPSRSFAMAKDLVPLMASGKKIVIVPVARSGASIVTLGNPFASDFEFAEDELVAAIGEYPGARVIMSWTQGEADASSGMSTATYITNFNAMVNAFRGISGCEDMEVILHQLVPEKVRDDSAYALIDAAHKQIPLQLTKCWFIGSTIGYQIPSNLTHFDEAGNRIAGVRAAAQVDFANTLSAAAPQAVSGIAIAPSSVTFSTPSGGASRYNVQLRDRGSSDSWTDNVVYPAYYLEPGDAITVSVATDGKEARIIASSYGGDTTSETVSAALTISGGGGGAARTSPKDIRANEERKKRLKQIQDDIEQTIRLAHQRLTGKVTEPAVLKQEATPQRLAIHAEKLAKELVEKSKDSAKQRTRNKAIIAELKRQADIIMQEEEEAIVSLLFH